MLTSKLAGADIPDGFLTQYQRNFSLLVFDTAKGVPVDTYQERVEFRALIATESDELGDFGIIEGKPKWVLEDESPATYKVSIPMAFLLQIVPGCQFPINKAAPPQIEIDLMGKPTPSQLCYYQLFLGNALYLFGTTMEEPLVYAITQVD